MTPFTNYGMLSGMSFLKEKGLYIFPRIQQVDHNHNLIFQRLLIIQEIHSLVYCFPYQLARFFYVQVLCKLFLSYLEVRF